MLSNERHLVNKQVLLA